LSSSYWCSGINMSLAKPQPYGDAISAYCRSLPWCCADSAFACDSLCWSGSPPTIFPIPIRQFSASPNSIAVLSDGSQCIGGQPARNQLCSNATPIACHFTYCGDTNYVCASSAQECIDHCIVNPTRTACGAFLDCSYVDVQAGVVVIVNAPSVISPLTIALIVIASVFACGLFCYCYRCFACHLNGGGDSRSPVASLAMVAPPAATSSPPEMVVPT